MLMLVYVTKPRPVPCTVTDADPVTTVFVLRIQLPSDISKECNLVSVPCIPPAVIVTRLDPCIPPVVKHRTLDSEFHNVDSNAVFPALATGDKLNLARFAPLIVRLDDPVAWVFALNMPLVDVAS